jgi:hypothetical protein
MNYSTLKYLVVAISVFSIPLGVFIGWMMALGNLWLFAGIVVLMAVDYYGSVQWLKVIEEAARRAKSL